MGNLFDWGSESQADRELRQRLEMEALYEQAVRVRQARQSNMAIAGGGGSPVTDTAFKMLVNTSDNTFFDMEIQVTADTTFTFDAGNGTTFTGQLTTGTTSISYDYVLADSVWEARLTVADPSLVSRINIYSWRIMEFSNLQVFTNLQEFEADNNFLQSADFSGMSSLIDIDISDCQLPGQVGESLTTVNLTGCTNLEILYLDDSEFSAGLPSLAGLTSLRDLDVDGSQLSGTIDLSILPSLKHCDLSSNPGITNVIISSSQPIGEGGSRLNINGASLTQESVDAILVALSENGVTNANFVNLADGTSAAPSEIGLAAKEVLEQNGWNVIVNLPPPGTATIAPSTDFDIVGDFTIEMFINFSNLNGNPRPYSFGAYPNAANAISFEGSTFYFWANSSGSPRSFGPFSPSTGQWYHICVMRSGTDISLFVDGNEIASYLYSDPIPSQGLPLTIGNGNEPNSSLNGLISNFRWTSSAVYTIGGFIAPSAPLTDLPDTKLLIFQGTSLNAQLTDNSGNGHNAFGSGSITYSTEDPFSSLDGSIQLGTV